MAFIDDVWDAISDPKNLLRWVTLSGWSSYLADLLVFNNAQILQNSLFVALPGLVEGDNFADAWVGEVGWRCGAVTKFLGVNACGQWAESIKRYAGSSAPSALRSAIEEAKRLRGQGMSAKDALQRAGVDVRKIAADCRFQNPTRRDLCREDAVAAAINYEMREPVFDLRDFNVATGAYQPPGELTAAQRASLKTVPPLPPGAIRAVKNAYEEWELAIARAAPQAETDRLEKVYRDTLQLSIENELLLRPREAVGTSALAAQRSIVPQLLTAAALTSLVVFLARPALKRRGLWPKTPKRGWLRLPKRRR